MSITKFISEPHGSAIHRRSVGLDDRSAAGTHTRQRRYAVNNTVKQILNLVICIILCGCVLLPFWVYFFSGNGNASANKPELVADHLVDIKGFTYVFNRINNGALVLKADRLTVTKTKFGHISLGGFTAARLKNVTIKFDQTSPEETHHQGGHSNAILYDSVLGGIDMPFSSMNRILSVRMAPIQIELMHRGKVTTNITAESAAIRTRTGDMVFKHGVIVSGSRCLKTARLRVSSDFNVVKALEPYVLTIPDGEYRGNRLNTDIHLTFAKTSESITRMKSATN